MSTSTLNEPLLNLLFEYRGADIVLRSCDFHHFRVPKVYIINCSPVLDECIQKTLHRSQDDHGEASLPVVQLPESGAILHNLLTYIFPVTPLVPSTAEKCMELLSVAQKYRMDSVLAHMRLNIARHIPPLTQRDSALRIYSLAQKYGLRQEALQAARTVLNFPMSIKDLEKELNVMSGASLYELWKYSEGVRAILASDLTEFRSSGARGTLTSLQCVDLTSSRLPCWLDDYIVSIEGDISLFDFIEFGSALARHTEAESGEDLCACVSIPSQTIRKFWKALSSVIDGSFEKVSLMWMSCLQDSRLCRQSRLYRLFKSERSLNPKLIRLRHYLNPSRYPTRISSFDRPTLPTSESTNQYWSWRPLSSKIYFPFPSLPIANQLMGSPSFKCLKTLNF
jgi:hypothetical protein